MAITRFNSNAVPWRNEENDVFDPIIEDLIASEINGLHKTPFINLSAKQNMHLTRLFKSAGFGRSKAQKFMTEFIRNVGISIDTSAIKIAQLKDRSKAGQKIYSDKRSDHDLARGRIILDTPKHYETAIGRLRQIQNDGKIRGFRMNGVRIAKDRHGDFYSDYISDPRKSGYAGSINLDLDIDVGNGKIGGFELQIMPWDFEDAYDHSHCLYNFIRHLDERLLERNTPDREEVILLRRALIRANGAIFDEHAQRADYMKFRKIKPKPFTIDEAMQINDILDRFSTTASTVMRSRDPREHKKAQEILNAVKEAKTSIQNLLLPTLNGDIQRILAAKNPDDWKNNRPDDGDSPQPPEGAKSD